MELKEWQARSKSILLGKRIWATLLFLGLTVSVLVIPWRNTIVTDAVIEARLHNVVYLNTAGRLTGLLVAAGQKVVKGQLIARLKNPELSFRLHQTENLIARQKELKKSATLDAGFRQESAVIATELVRLETQRAALKEEINNLEVRAPIAGKITEFSPNLSLGQWLGVGQKLTAIKGGIGIKLTGYVNEEDVFRIHKAGACRLFLLGSYNTSYQCRVVDVGRSAERVLEAPVLASKFGGNISVSEVEGALVPDKAIYKVSAIVKKQEIHINRQQIGMLKLDADKNSILKRFWRWSVAVIIRESGL